MTRRSVAAILVSFALVCGGVLSGELSPAAAYPLGDGYWTAAQDGGIFSFGDSQFFGSTGAIKLNKPIVDMAATPFLEGYWLVATDGGIFTFGSAGFFGSTGNIVLNKPIVGMAAHPNGLGYWLVASDGGIFTFGDSRFFGSTGAIKLNKPIVGMAATPSGNGYWLVATDGGIFTFGDAAFFGSMGAIPLNKPVVGMAATSSGQGYYMVASDGGIFTFGDAVFRGSMGAVKLNAPVVGMDVTASGNGYQFVATDGGIFNFGDSQFFGSMGGTRLNLPMLGMGIRPRFAIKVDAFTDDANQSSSWATAPDGDEQLVLTKIGAAGNPAGARIYGVEGLDVSQLGQIGFTLDGGACGSSPIFTLFYDVNGDRVGDASTSFSCSTGGAGAVKSYDPVALGVPAGAVVTALDLYNGTASSTVTVDDILVNGLVVGGTSVTRAA